MHLLTSNFNLLSTNNNWNYLKKKKIFLDNKYSNYLILLNNKRVLSKYQSFHILIYLDENNLSNTLKSLSFLIKKKLSKEKKAVFFYFVKGKDFANLKEKIFLNELSKVISKFYNSNNSININLIQDLKNSFFNERNRIFLRFPFDTSFIKKISKNINENVNIINSKPYKLIILDCDNTLWGGILDEDGFENLKFDTDGIGTIYKEFQKKLLNLRKQGFILTISSKNTDNKVWMAMKKRKMILQKKDFVNPKINWNDKGQNIQNIINELTLRPADCIFIDDNILEIKKVKNLIKGINTIHLNDPCEILNYIRKDNRFKKIKVLTEDLNKYEQYKIKSEYEEISNKTTHSLSFFRSLKQKVKILSCSSVNFERTIQLFNKTNQFNFNLNRYNSVKLSRILKNKLYEIKLIEFKDKFGSHGIVGAYIIKKNRNFIEIVDFVLSCRVLNRYVEDYFLNHILQYNKSKKYFIYYNETNVNKELIPRFLKKDFFKFIKKNKNIKKYEIQKTKKINDIKKIFN